MALSLVPGLAGFLDDLRMEKIHLKIRGIYTTALTRLFLDMGYGISYPSQEIMERFEISDAWTSEDISIDDRDDRQGIRVIGKRAPIKSLMACFQEILLDLVVRKEPSPQESVLLPDDEQIVLEIEFPGASKAVLDGLRGRQIFTITHHHRLRIIASDLLDLAEQEIERAPFGRNGVERDLMERVLYQPLRKRGWIEFKHVKPEGEILNLRGGEILSMESGRLLLRRQFHTGRYDGLDLEIEPGDYGITEVVEGTWSLRHSYFSERGSLKGEYVNINTPIELYPDGVRYVDLHVDVVRKEGEKPRIIDQDKLDAVTRRGLIGGKLHAKALEVVRDLMEQLGGSGYALLPAF